MVQGAQYNSSSLRYIESLAPHLMHFPDAHVFTRRLWLTQPS